MQPMDRPALATRLLELTEEMLALARAGDWSAFGQCERDRRLVSQELFALPVPPADAPAVTEQVRRVLELDQALIALATQGRAEAAQALRDAHLGQRAVDAYRRYAR